MREGGNRADLGDIVQVAGKVRAPGWRRVLECERRGDGSERV